MTRVALIVLLLLGCKKKETFDDLKLPSPGPTDFLRLAPPPPPPPPPLPPPPPPPPPGPTPPPAAISTFLEQPSSDPWVITIDDRQLSRIETTQLVARLSSDQSYSTGDIGCFVDKSTQVKVVRGTRTLSFAINCGHVVIDGDAHAAILSSSMIEFIEELRTKKTR